jgi:hypothetical protein
MFGVSFSDLLGGRKRRGEPSTGIVWGKAGVREELGSLRPVTPAFTALRASRMSTSTSERLEQFIIILPQAEILFFVGEAGRRPSCSVSVGPSARVW